MKQRRKTNYIAAGCTWGPIVVVLVAVAFKFLPQVVAIPVSIVIVFFGFGIIKGLGSLKLFRN